MLPAARPATLLWTAAGVAVVLTALSLWVRITALDPGTDALFGQYPPTGFSLAYRLFNADAERNVPTWFSAVLLLLIALRSLAASTLPRDRGAPLRRYWLGLAGVFAYLSLDEVAVIHEALTPHMAFVVPAEGALALPWVAAVAPLVAVFVLVYIRFLWKLPRRTAALFLLAGVLYVGGALGLEMVGAPFFGEARGATLSYVLVTSAEELLEMTGATLCLYTVARYADELTRRAHDEPPVPARETPQRDDGGRTTAKGSVTSSAADAKR